MAAPQIVPIALTFDPAFGGGDGRSQIGFHGFHVQPDGEIIGSLFAGTPQIAWDVSLGNLGSNGEFDLSFGTNGAVHVDGTNIDGGSAAVSDFDVQADGKLLGSGYSQAQGPSPEGYVFRWNADGTLDTSFGGDGKIFLPVGSNGSQAASMVLQPDGKILLGATIGTDISAPAVQALIRLNPDGTLDTSFSGDGITPTADFLGPFGGAFDILPDGKIVTTSLLESGEIVITRLNADGSLDTSVTSNGVAALAFTPPPGTFSHSRSFDDAVFLADGKVLIACHNDYNDDDVIKTEVTVFRLNANGSVDATFDPIQIGPMNSFAVGCALTVKPDNTIVVAVGANSSMTVTQYDFGGTSLGAGVSFPAVVPTDLELGPDGSVFVSSYGVVAKLISVPEVKDQLATADAPFDLVIHPALFSDPDGDSLSFTATLADGSALPAWLSFNGSGLAFAGTPANADVGALSVELKATDPGGLSVSLLFSLTVNPSPIFGTIGNDTIVGTLGNDTIQGLDGDDSIVGASGDDQIHSGSGNDVLSGGLDNDFLFGQEGLDSLNGGEGHDTVRGAQDNDIVNGGDGNDIVRAGRGDDALSGGNGDDSLGSGIGNDQLTGGAGSDHFQFFRTGDTNADTVQDFSVVEGDVIDLDSRVELTALTPGALDPAQFQVLVRYDSVSGELSYDADGDGVGSLLIATLTGAPTLTAADIFVV